VRALDRRLVELEAQLALPRPKADLEALCPWLRWVSHDDLDWLEQLYRSMEHGAEPSEVDRLRAVEIEARATRAMLAGEPPP
jgi:hypothetical protein